MAKIRKLNVSEITGTSPYTGDTDAIMPSGTVVVYEKDNNGVIEHVLRVHDGVTNGGVAISPGPGPVIFNGSDGIVRDNLNEGIAAVFNNGTAYITGGNSVRFTGLDTGNGTSESVLRFWNAEGRHSTATDTTELVTLDVGNDAAPEAPTEGFLKIITEKETGSNKEWKFDSDGVLTLPTGGDIVDSTGASVLGGAGDANIWIQTFASQDGFPGDVVGLATSVEYDNAGNIIALFSHQTGIGEFNIPSGSYFSVAKFTAAGQKLWQVRLTAGLSFYTDGWGLSVDNVAGRIYVAGRVAVEGSYNKSSLIKLNSEDGSLIWSNVYDFGDRSDSPVVDVDSDGNPVMVGYFSTDVEDNDGVTVTKISKLDGTVVWSRLLDGQGDDEAYGMAVGPAGEVVAVGYMDQYDEPLSHPVTPQTGSGVNVLVINRSDLSGDTLTDTWEVSGTGITGTIGVNAINVYTGLTGTVRQGSDATFDFVIAGDGSITNPVTVANGGTNYLVGHKIKIPYTLIGGADANSDIILTVTGATDGVITSVAAGFFGGGAGSPNNYYSAIGTNYQTGSGLTFDLELDSGSTYTEHPFNITAAGSNYVTGDTVTIPGTQLGGTSPANDLIATVSTDAGGVTTFNTFLGNQQTTTYRVRTEDGGPDFSGVGTWTLSGVLVDNDDRMLVVKYDSTGAIQWQKAIQFDAGYSCRGADADIDSQGNVYVCGNYDYDAGGDTNSAMNLVKFNSSGVKQWSRRVVGPCEDFATSIVVGPDDTLYLSGVTGSFVNDDPRFVWVVAKYTTSGTVVWQRLIENTTGWTFGGAGFFSTAGGSNLSVGEGYVALSGGFGEPFSGIPAATVVQIDTDGTVFTVGDWEFKAATFSGTLNSSASDITVVNAEKVNSAITSIAVDDTLFSTDTTNFLIPTLYTAPSGNDSLVNGAYSVILGNTGTLTLPAGGTITEGYVTSNPTIQLTPASPDVASQKLVIKGGAIYNFTDNGININYNTNTALVGDTLTFYISSNTYADQTLYWWIYPEGAGIGDTESGTVVLTGSSGSFSILVDSDDYEFTVRVSPEDNNYDPASLGVESGLINPDAPTFDAEHHLHLTTGNLAETSIFLGTDDHNVRTTVNGGIEITTPNDTNNVWNFGVDGNLTVPGDIRSEGNIQIRSVDNLDIVGDGIVTLRNNSATDGIQIRTDDGDHSWNFGIDGNLTVPGDIRSEGSINIDINLSDSTLRRWQFGEDGDLTFPDGTNYSGNDITVPSAGIPTGVSNWNDQGGWDQSSYTNVATTGGTGTGLTVDVAAGGGGYISIDALSINTPGTGYTNGDVITVNNENNLPATFTITVPVNTWTFGTDGTTTLPGAITRVVAGTVAKTGVILPTTTGVVTGLTPSSVLSGLTDGTYGPFTLTGVTLSVVVFGGVINGFTNLGGTATVNDVLGTVDSGDIGGTAGTTITITVNGVVQATPTALDLTKTVNKLTDGAYSLADGVEGQIMHLVRQTGSTYNAIMINVANARVNGGLETTIDYYPFETSLNMSTLIFTDGAWQASVGGWD